MPLEWLFGRRMSPDEMLRKNQRALNKAMRDLDRENMRMEQQEKKIIMDIKKMAKDGQMVSHILNILYIFGSSINYLIIPIKFDELLVKYIIFLYINSYAIAVSTILSNIKIIIKENIKLKFYYQ